MAINTQTVDDHQNNRMYVFRIVIYNQDGTETGERYIMDELKEALKDKKDYFQDKLIVPQIIVSQEFDFDFIDPTLHPDRIGKYNVTDSIDVFKNPDNYDEIAIQINQRATVDTESFLKMVMYITENSLHEPVTEDNLKQTLHNIILNNCKLISALIKAITENEKDKYFHLHPNNSMDDFEKYFYDDKDLNIDFLDEISVPYRKTVKTLHNVDGNLHTGNGFKIRKPKTSFLPKQYIDAIDLLQKQTKEFEKQAKEAKLKQFIDSYNATRQKEQEEFLKDNERKILDTFQKTDKVFIIQSVKGKKRQFAIYGNNFYEKTGEKEIQIVDWKTNKEDYNDVLYLIDSAQYWDDIKNEQLIDMKISNRDYKVVRKLLKDGNYHFLFRFKDGEHYRYGLFDDEGQKACEDELQKQLKGHKNKIKVDEEATQFEAVMFFHGQHFEQQKDGKFVDLENNHLKAASNQLGRTLNPSYQIEKDGKTDFYGPYNGKPICCKDIRGVQKIKPEEYENIKKLFDPQKQYTIQLDPKKQQQPNQQGMNNNNIMMINNNIMNNNMMNNNMIMNNMNNNQNNNNNNNNNPQENKDKKNEIKIVKYQPESKKGEPTVKPIFYKVDPTNEKHLTYMDDSEIKNVILEQKERTEVSFLKYNEKTNTEGYEKFYIGNLSKEDKYYVKENGKLGKNNEQKLTEQKWAEPLNSHDNREQPKILDLLSQLSNVKEPANKPNDKSKDNKKEKSKENKKGQSTNQSNKLPKGVDVIASYEDNINQNQAQNNQAQNNNQKASKHTIYKIKNRYFYRKDNESKYQEICHPANLKKEYDKGIKLSFELFKEIIRNDKDHRIIHHDNGVDEYVFKFGEEGYYSLIINNETFVNCEPTSYEVQDLISDDKKKCEHEEERGGYTLYHVKSEDERNNIIDMSKKNNIEEEKEEEIISNNKNESQNQNPLANEKPFKAGNKHFYVLNNNTREYQLVTEKNIAQLYFGFNNHLQMPIENDNNNINNLQNQNNIGQANMNMNNNMGMGMINMGIMNMNNNMMINNNMGMGMMNNNMMNMMNMGMNMMGQQNMNMNMMNQPVQNTASNRFFEADHEIFIIPVNETKPQKYSEYLDSLRKQTNDEENAIKKTEKEINELKEKLTKQQEKLDELIPSNNRLNNKANTNEQKQNDVKNVKKQMEELKTLIKTSQEQIEKCKQNLKNIENIEKKAREESGIFQAFKKTRKKYDEKAKKGGQTKQMCSFTTDDNQNKVLFRPESNSYETLYELQNYDNSDNMPKAITLRKTTAAEITQQAKDTMLCWYNVQLEDENTLSQVKNEYLGLKTVFPDQQNNPTNDAKKCIKLFNEILIAKTDNQRNAQRSTQNRNNNQRDSRNSQNQQNQQKFEKAPQIAQDMYNTIRNNQKDVENKDGENKEGENKENKENEKKVFGLSNSDFAVYKMAQKETYLNSLVIKQRTTIPTGRQQNQNYGFNNQVFQQNMMPQPQQTSSRDCCTFILHPDDEYLAKQIYEHYFLECIKRINAQQQPMLNNNINLNNNIINNNMQGQFNNNNMNNNNIINTNSNNNQSNFNFNNNNYNNNNQFNNNGNNINMNINNNISNFNNNFNLSNSNFNNMQGQFNNNGYNNNFNNNQSNFNFNNNNSNQYMNNNNFGGNMSNMNIMNGNMNIMNNNNSNMNANQQLQNQQDNPQQNQIPEDFCYFVENIDTQLSQEKDEEDDKEENKTNILINNVQDNKTPVYKMFYKVNKDTYCLRITQQKNQRQPKLTITKIDIKEEQSI